MSKIERYSNWSPNWSYVDRLDGIALENGERLHVQFPDDSPLEIVVKVQARTIPIPDMGHTYDGLESFAYAEINYRGVSVLVPLVGLEARRL